MKNAKIIRSRQGQAVQISKKVVAKAGGSDLEPTSKSLSERVLGLMQGRASCVIHGDFKLTDQEILSA